MFATHIFCFHLSNRQSTNNQKELAVFSLNKLFYYWKQKTVGQNSKEIDIKSKMTEMAFPLPNPKENVIIKLLKRLKSVLYLGLHDVRLRSKGPGF